MIEAMSQTVADLIRRIGIISIWKTHPRRSPINEKSPILTILTTSENQALVFQNYYKHEKFSNMIMLLTTS